MNPLKIKVINRIAYLSLIIMSGCSSIPDGGLWMLVGTYTAAESEGIYLYRFDPGNASAEYVSMAGISNPSYLAFSADGNFVYAVSEEDDETASVSSFRFDRVEGTLELMNTIPTQGAAPCYISVSRDGKHVLTANYVGGSISVLSVLSDGRLGGLEQLIAFEGHGPDIERQEAPHLHCVDFTPDGKYIFATDLGTDNIYRFEVDYSGDGPFVREGSLKAYPVAPGSGPRHFAFRPDGKYMYLLNELSGVLMVFDYSEGDISLIQAVQADPSDAGGSADVAFTPDGKYLYTSHRLKDDGINTFAVQADGRVEQGGFVRTGSHPRNISVTPDGRYLLSANRDGNNVEIYSIGDDGALERRGEIGLSMPVCVVFAPL